MSQLVDAQGIPVALDGEEPETACLAFACPECGELAHDVPTFPLRPSEASAVLAGKVPRGTAFRCKCPGGTPMVMALVLKRLDAVPAPPRIAPVASCGAD